jgi:hypothetical protein
MPDNEDFLDVQTKLASAKPEDEDIKDTVNPSLTPSPIYQ